MLFFFLLVLLAVFVRGVLGGKTDETANGADGAQSLAADESNQVGDATTDHEGATNSNGDAAAASPPEEGSCGVAQIDFVFDSWDEAFSDYSATSFFRMDITPEEEGELGPLVSPDLVGG